MFNFNIKMRATPVPTKQIHYSLDTLQIRVHVLVIKFRNGVSVL